MCLRWYGKRTVCIPGERYGGRADAEIYGSRISSGDGYPHDEFGNGSAAVSYTHLDVYKRQGNTMLEYPQGFAVSKISDSFLEHQDTIGYFGIDDVCSFVAAPFLKNGKLTSLLITYVRMKDNWHGSIERYMLNEEDVYKRQMVYRRRKESRAD